jgi:hypothetical protein
VGPEQAAKENKANDSRHQDEQTMKSALPNPGEKIHVMHRRRFEKDVRRHFVGQVEA